MIDALSETHNHIKSLEQETKKVATKIIADAKNDNRILDQKVTETINNNTVLETRMKNLEKLQIFISDSFETLEQDMAKNTSKTKDHYDKEYIDRQHQQLQISITKTHNHI